MAEYGPIRCGVEITEVKRFTERDDNVGDMLPSHIATDQIIYHSEITTVNVVDDMRVETLVVYRLKYAVQ